MSSMPQRLDKIAEHVVRLDDGCFVESGGAMLRWRTPEEGRV